MPVIDPRQWRPLFDAVYEMNTAKHHADFSSAVAQGMSRLIPAEQMLDRKTQRMVFRMLPECRYTQAELG